MLKTIEITNFKGVGDTVHIPIRPITLMFGANSSGKSTILHALHYAHEVLNHRNFDVDITERGGESLNFGGFKNLVHRRDLNRQITLSFELDLSSIDIEEYASVDPIYNISAEVKSARLSFSIGWNALDGKPYPTAYAVDINGFETARLQAESSGKGITAHYNIQHPLVEKIWGKDVVGEYDQWFPIQIEELRSVLPVWGKPLKYADAPPDGMYLPHGDHIMSQVLVGVGEIFADYLSKLRYVGPMRAIMPRNYEQILSRSDLRWSDGSAAWDSLLSGTHNYRQQVSQWLGDENKLNSGYSLRLRKFKEVDLETPLALAIKQGAVLDDIENLSDSFEKLPIRQRLLIVNKESGMELSPHDLGIGISQIIPVVATSLLPTSVLVAIEQPELHIHPAVQVGLGELFASQIRDRSCLFLVETHSEHLLLRLLRRIRETYAQELPQGAASLTPDDLSVVYVENNNGTVSLIEIRVDKEGEFKDCWPKGFFAERAEELF